MMLHNIEYPLPTEHYNKLLLHVKNEKMDLRFGTVFLAKGTRIPEEGFTRHPQHELSIVQKGNIQMLNEDGTTKAYLKTGDLVYMEAFEAQAGIVMEDTKIIYMLIAT